MKFCRTNSSNIVVHIVHIKSKNVRTFIIAWWRSNLFFPIIPKSMFYCRLGRKKFIFLCSRWTESHRKSRKYEKIWNLSKKSVTSQGSAAEHEDLDQIFSWVHSVPITYLGDHSRIVAFCVWSDPKVILFSRTCEKLCVYHEEASDPSADIISQMNLSDPTKLSSCQQFVWYVNCVKCWERVKKRTANVFGLPSEISVVLEMSRYLPLFQ